MAVVTGDRYLDSLVKFVDKQAGQLIEGALVLKLNPVGLHYVQSRLEALSELEGLVTGAPVDYLRAYVCDLGDHRALEQLRRILRLLTALKVVSVLPHPARDPTPISLLPFGRLKVLELRGCDLSTSAARGLLQLRHTLEKIICHNSTDALRHVFASRISEIKGSPQWNRLSFVSCACNDLVLMDESLQLLPVVETLDISRNKFAKVDNLRKCTRLKHLDLGFNQLRTVASFSEVSCQIVKLVLRNNSLTSLRGIENLKSLEGLDLSYNIISNFFELEILSGLHCLHNLWLEGNPLSCARWYRAQVFSFFPHPDKLNLDEKKISTEEYWKRHIVIASRQKRPASFGFYSPAKCDDELERYINIKRRKHSRVASIESEEQVLHIGSDLESVSCDNETQTREENIISEEEGEIVGLMNRIELMKKERSARWLQEFKEWLIQDPEKYVHASKYNGVTLDSEKEHRMRSKADCRFVGESSRYVSDSVQASGDESSTNILESDSSFADISSSFNAHHYIDRMSDSTSNLPLRKTSEISVFSAGRMDMKQEQMISGTNGSFLSVGAGKRHFGSLAVTGERGNGNNCITPNIADDIVESDTSVFPGSPPHYQEDILHRRLNLEEEFLQLSAESLSVASSDSITSCGDDDISEFGPVIPESDQSLMEVFSVRSGHLSINHTEDNYYERRRGGFKGKQNGMYLAGSQPELTSHARRRTHSDHSQQWFDDDDDGFSHSEYSVDATHYLKQKGAQMKKKNFRKKPKKRLVMLSGESNGAEERTAGENGYLNVYVSTGDDERRKEIISRSVLMSVNSKHMEDTTSSHTIIGATSHPGLQCSSQEAQGFIENYFNYNIADLNIQEICKQCILCNCILEQKTGHEEREVALVLSSEEKFYVLLLDANNDGSGVSIRLIDWHKIEDITEVLVGLGLQLLRLYFEKGATYLFTTRSVDKSRELLDILHSFDSDIKKDKFSINSLEQVQVRLFSRNVCGDSKASIYQYSMAHFWKNNMEDDVWLSRSLFVLEKHLLVCAEDFVQFGSISGEMSSSPYFSLDSCCFISDVSEMVIDTQQNWCLSLTVKRATSQFRRTLRKDKVKEATFSQEASTSGPLRWKLRWSSEDSMSNFIALVKAIHRGLVSSPLVVRSQCD